MPKSTGRPTLADVARRANVSITSVSRTLNKTGPINPDTQARIEAAMAELGYKPRRPGKGSGQTIAILTGDLLNAYFPEVIRGVQEEADSYGLLTMLFTFNDQPHRWQYIIQKINRGVADAIVLMGSPLPPALAEVQFHRRIPLVVINRRACGPVLGSITVDFENAGYRATQHLLMLGHTRIGFLSLPNSSLDICVSRRRGVEMALKDANLVLRPEWDIVCPTGQDMDGGFYATSSLLSRPPANRPTALVCFNDGIAVGVEHAVWAAGLRVPDDLSIVGFDDIAIAAHATPPLTTVSQPKYRIGVMAVQMLRRMLQDPTITGDCVQTESPLVVRESTGPCIEKIPA